MNSVTIIFTLFLTARQAAAKVASGKMSGEAANRVVWVVVGESGV